MIPYHTLRTRRLRESEVANYSRMLIATSHAHCNNHVKRYVAMSFVCFAMGANARRGACLHVISGFGREVLAAVHHSQQAR